MTTKTKSNVIQHQETAARKLAARIELLKSRGLDEAAIKKESFVKKLNADIRKAKRQLTALSDQEKLIEQKAKAKADKLAAAKNAEKAPKAKAAEPAPKPKKEKKSKEKKAPAA